MNKIKSTLSAAGASLVLALGMAGAAAADAVAGNSCGSDIHGPGHVTCTASATDSSTATTVSGSCSAYINSKTTQVNGNLSVQLGSSEATNTSRQVAPRGTDNTNVGVSSSTTTQSNTTSQSNSSSLTFAPDCSNSTTNVTQQVASTGGMGGGSEETSQAAQTAAAETESPQVVVPRGAVHAGGGAGVASSSAPAFVGLTGSVASLGLGLVMRKKALFDL